MCLNDEQNLISKSQFDHCKRVVGFDAKNKDSLLTYICQMCTFILRNPCQLSCGHRFCHSCLIFAEESIIKCDKCGEETCRERLLPDKGCQLDMVKLNIICSLCEWNGIFKDYEEHLNNYHGKPFCEHCDQKFDSVNSLNQHTSVCEKFPIDCILQPYGCHEQFFRINTQDHYLSNRHQSVLLKLLTQKHSQSIKDSDDEQSVSSRSTTSDESLPADLKQFYETTELLVGGVQALSDDTQHLSSESLRCQNMYEFLSEEYSKMKISVQETNSLFDAHKSNQQILEQSLASLQQHLADSSNTSYDGTLIWKITNVQQKIADAQSDRQTSIYSQPFYSSPNGYKMRARLYLTGDGNARRSHMSIFFVLMRGDYDAILQFPFNFKVTFCLFDQTTQQRHIIDSFRPDTKSSSFQRPKSDMNVASGIPRFVPLTMIQQDNSSYVRDDTMLIKIMVDFNNIPKTVLPYTFSLNPGLPLLIQQEYMKRELEKQAKEKSSNTSQELQQTNAV